MPPRARSLSAPPMVRPAIRTPWLQAIEREFAVVKPGDSGNSEGNCRTCAMVTATALVRGTEPYLAGGHQEVDGGHRQGRFNKGDLIGVCQMLFRASLGCVFIVEDLDDHTFVVVKRFDNNLYMVDSNSHTYRELTSDVDFELRKSDGTIFNAAEPGDDGLVIWYWGLLSERWQ